MYQKIMNRLDVEILQEAFQAENIDNAVISRIKEVVSVLDKEYGECRNSSDMGGYILFFGDTQTYDKFFSEIIEFYHLDKDLFEYSEHICGTESKDVEWCEKLYLVSSDDSLVFIYPRKIENGNHV